MAGDFHVVVNGEQKGPFGQTEITAMLENGEMQKDTYVWREGMDEWAMASSVPELASLLKTHEKAEPKIEIKKPEPLSAPPQKVKTAIVPPAKMTPEELAQKIRSGEITPQEAQKLLSYVIMPEKNASKKK